MDRLAQTPGVPRVSRSAVLAAVPAGHAARPEAGRSAALGSQPLGFVIASPAFPPSAGPTSAGPPSTLRRAEQQPGDQEWRNPRPQWDAGEPQVRAPGEPGCARAAGTGGRGEGAVTLHARAAQATERQGSGDCSVWPGGRCEATGAPRRPSNLRFLLC